MFLSSSYLQSPKEMKNQIENNQGFSLIEVIVCIALIALICVPLFSGFQLTARLNSRAHYTQNVTEYVQGELETVKSLSVEDYTAVYKGEASPAEAGVTCSYITSGTEWQEMADRASAIEAQFSAPASMTLAEKERLFKPFICEKRDISIGSKKYTMKVKFMPAEYSQFNESDTAASVNVAGYYDVAEADAVNFPVIADEINLYDATCITALYEKAKAIGIAVASEADIAGDIKKNIVVTIDSVTDSTKVDVKCDVSYVYPKDSPEVELNYRVYSSSYDIYPTAGEKIGSESGGKVFIMANAFKSTYDECYNRLEINSSGNTDVYFILGRRAGSDDLYNFNSVQINGLSYLDNYNVNNALVPGEMSIPGTDGWFYSNIKTNGFILNDAHKDYETIGTESYRAISYAIEIDMYDQTDGNTKVAHMETTKIDK